MEAKIGTYLEVKCGAKWDPKVVALMDAILDVYLDANMVLTGMSFRNQKRMPSRKRNRTLFRKQKGMPSRKQNRTLFRKETSTLFRKQRWTLFWKQKISAILDVIKDAI